MKNVGHENFAQNTQSLRGSALVLVPGDGWRTQREEVDGEDEDEDDERIKSKRIEDYNNLNYGRP